MSMLFKTITFLLIKIASNVVPETLSVLLEKLKLKNSNKHKRLIKKLFLNYTNYSLSINKYQRIRKKLLKSIWRCRLSSPQDQPVKNLTGIILFKGLK